MNTTRYNPCSSLAPAFRPKLAALSLVAALATVCGCGGSGGSSGPQSTCFEQPGSELGGTWTATGTVIEIDTGVYVPSGLDDLVFDLEFVLGTQDQGICSLLYAGTSASLDTVSPTGGPSTMLAGAGPLLPSGTFGLSGMFHYPAGDVTTSFDVESGSLQHISPTSFRCVVNFEVYDGDQITLVVDDVPGFDDDGDGLIDEPDELEPGDGIDPGAFLLCEGRMELAISRGAPLAASNSGSAPTAIPGILRTIDGEGAYPARMIVYIERAAVLLDASGLDCGGHRMRLVAPLDETGRFAARSADRETQIEMSGRLSSELIPEAVVRVHAARGTSTFILEPSSASDRSQ